MHSTAMRTRSISMPTIDEQNRAYWDELCGSNLAAVLGIGDASPASLAKYDESFFYYEPWFFDHVPLAQFDGKDVLEVGLGYGSLAQKIAESGARFTGLDIAQGPVEMVRHRLRQAALPGRAAAGSILAAPFPDQSFDYVVSIGCLHHTGDLKKAIDECWRLLRPHGALVFMVYYAYSYLRWFNAHKQTLKYLRAEMLGYRGVVPGDDAAERRDYDFDSKGNVAPYTDFISVRSMRHLLRRFSSVHWKRQNIAQHGPFKKRTREELLKTRWPEICGLEIWGIARK